MYLFDHTTESWRQGSNAINGAVTYSIDIVKYQLPEWEKVLGPRDLLSTAPPPHTLKLPSNINNAIIYLHSWPVNEDMMAFQTRFVFPAKNIIYITAYKPYCEVLRKNGHQAVYIPMSIDASNIQQYSTPKTSVGFVYYGNITQVKQSTYRHIKRKCRDLRIKLDTISHNIYNGRKLTQEEALSIVSSYKYGIGVGRCALEMHALGLKTIIAGRRFGGLITNEDEYTSQQEVNMNSRIVTYSDQIEKCLLNIDESIIKVSTIKSHVNEVLKNYLIHP